MSGTEVTRALPAAPAEPAVRVVDIPLRRVRRPADLVLMLVSLVGIAAVLTLGIYASRTTTGVIDDITDSPLSGVIDVISNILLLPVNVIEGWLTLILPIVVIAERLIRRNPVPWSRRWRPRSSPPFSPSPPPG